MHDPDAADVDFDRLRPESLDSVFISGPKGLKVGARVRMWFGPGAERHAEIVRVLRDGYYLTKGV